MIGAIKRHNELLETLTEMGDLSDKALLSATRATERIDYVKDPHHVSQGLFKENSAESRAPCYEPTILTLPILSRTCQVTQTECAMPNCIWPGRQDGSLDL